MHVHMHTHGRCTARVQVVWLRDPSAWIACGEEAAGAAAAARHTKGLKETEEIEKIERTEGGAAAAAAAGRARGTAGREVPEPPEPYTKLLCSELGPADVMVG